MPRTPRSPELLLAAAAVAVAAAVVVRHVVAPPEGDGLSFWAMPAAAAIGYGTTAAVLARAGRATVVRRVLLAVAVAQAVALAASAWADLGLDGGWPMVREAHWLASWLWSPAYVAIGAVLPLVLPDGRPRWRWAVWLSGAAVTWTAVSWALTPYHLRDVPTTTGLTNPVGVDAVASGPVVALGAVLAITAVAVALASAVARWRDSTGVERDRLQWLLLGLLASVALAGLSIGGAVPVGELVAALAVLPFPASVAVALLRHRLYDVEVVLSRSLAYALLTGAAVAGYVVAVALLGGVLGESSGAPVLVTAVVALAVLPLHARLQRLVNRLVHGDDDDPYTALARLGDRLEAAAAPGVLADDVLPQLAHRVRRVLRVPWAAVDLTDGSRTVAGTPSGDGTVVPLVLAGTDVGALVAGGELSRGDRRVLDRLAQQAAVAAHAVLLARDAARARAEAASAREEERRRLRRDLHDGMGPVLAAVALQAETARDLVAADPAAATALLDRLVPRLNDAVQDVRTLVHDLRPPTLDDLGLEGAVRELAARFATPTRAVAVEAGDLGALPAAVDLAAYRVVGEALANAARHSGAVRVGVNLHRDADGLHVEVHDDGRGADPSARPGVGLRSMRERAEELGGRCAVEPAFDGGTVVRALLPVADVPAQRLVEPVTA